MYCKNCGKELETGSTYCKNCGWKEENINEEKIEPMDLEQVSQDQKTSENNIQNFNNVQNAVSDQNKNSNIYAQNSVNQSNVDSTQQNTLNQNMQSNLNSMQNASNVQNFNNNQNINRDAYALNNIGVSSANITNQSTLNNNQYNNANDNQTNNINNMSTINNTQNTIDTSSMQSNNMQENNFSGNISNNLNQSYTEQSINQNNLNQNSGKKQGFLGKTVNNKPLFISLIVIFALIIIGLLIFIIVTVSNQNSNKQSVVKNDITTTKKQETTTTKRQEITTTTQGGNKNVSTSNVVTLSGYEFTIPNDLYHKIQSDQLLVNDTIGSFAAGVSVNAGSYDYFKANLSLLEDNLNQSGYTVITSGEKNYSGLNYLTIQLQYSGIDTYFAIYKLSNTEVAVSVVILNNSTPDNAFGRLSEILKTANKVGSSPTSEFNINEFSKEIGELGE